MRKVLYVLSAVLIAGLASGCDELNSIAVNIGVVTTLFDLVTPILQGVLDAVVI